jgi:PAS domain S-box-containing protein
MAAPLTLSDTKSTIRVLLVDDDLSLLETSKTILSDENNFEVDYATSVSEALKKMEQQNYDAVVSDYEMPVKNGLDFLRELREQRDDIPFILFTGRGREDVVVKALNLGADCYINKNGSPQTVYCELADAITKTVERKKSKQLLIESEIKYRTLVEKSLQGILITQTSPLRLVFANSAMGNMLGFSVEELKSLSPLGVAGLIHDDDKVIFFNRLNGRIHGVQAKSSLEFKAIRKDGSIVWLEVFSNRIEYMGEPAIQGIFLDITERRKAQENLQESEERYRELANSLPDIVFEADADGKVVFVNDKGFEIAGISHEDLEKGLNALEFLVPDDRERAMKNIQRLLATSSNIYDEYKLLKKDGSTFPIIVTATPRKSKNAITGFRALAIDISERKKTEETLKESEEKFRNLAEESPNMIFINCRGKVVYANKKCEDKLGIGRAEFYSSNFSFLSLIASEDVELLKSSFAKHMRGEAVPSYEYTLLARSGTRINAIITTKLIDYNGERAVMGIVTDITERKKTEELLKKNEEQLKAIISNAPIGIATSDEKQFFLSANEAFCKILGYSELELKRLTFRDITHPDEIKESNSNVENLKSGRVPFFSQEKRYIRKDGTTINGKVTVSIVKDNEDKPVTFIAELEDITEQKKLEFDQKQKYDVLERVGESIGAGLAIIGKDYRIFWANTLLRNTMDNSNKKCFQTFNKLDTICPNCGVKKVFEQNVSFDSHEFETINSAGEKIWIELRVTPLNDKNGVIMAALELAIPITERKKAETELQMAADIIELATDSIFVHDLDGKIVYFNDAACKSTGYSKEEMAKMNIHELDAFETEKLIESRIENLLKKGDAVFNSTQSRKDGALLQSEIHARIFTQDEKKLVLSISRDISERKKAEDAMKNAVGELFFLNEKLNVVGSLTRHDVRNKLFTIIANTYLLRKKCAGQEDILNGINKIEQAVKDSTKIFEFAKMYEQLGVEDLKYINVENMLNDATALFSSLNIRVINNCCGLSLLADSFLRQLFYNFIDNTIKYGKKTTFAKLYYEKDSQSGLQLVYEDDGVGISADDKAQLFKEGFSTGGSTGYGLFLTRKMIEVYGWKIKETGEPGKGAKFVISIPSFNSNGKENYRISR